MSLKQKTQSGLVWSGLQSFGTAGINLLVQVLLTKLISPDQFGLLGMILIFNAVGKTIADSGLSHSIIRMENPDDDDYSTLFVLNFVFALAIYLILFFTAPFISDYYDQNILTNLVRVYALIIPITALQTVQVTKLTKSLNFRLQTLIQIPSLIISGIVGLVLGYLGYGVWALVWMQVVQSFLLAIQYWMRAKYYPSFKLKKSKVKMHFNFGYKLLLSGLLDSVVSNIYPSVIGKFNNADQVGYYTQAAKFRQAPVSIFASAFGKVTYPILAEIQNDEDRLVQAYRRILKVILIMVAPVMCVLVLIAKPLFFQLFADRWLPMVPYFQLLCLIGILFPLHIYYLNSIKVKGRSDLYLKSEILKKIVLILVLFQTAKLGIIAIIIGQLVTSLVALVINQYYCSLVLKYSFWEQNKDALRIIIPTVILLGVTHFIVRPYLLDLPNVIYMFAISLVFSITYLGIHYFINKDSIEEFVVLVQKIKKR